MKDSLKNCCEKCYDPWGIYCKGNCPCHTTTEKKWNCIYGGTCLHKTCERASITGYIASTTDTNDNWQEWFDELIRHLTGATLDTPLISNASVLQTFIAKEKERSYDQGHCDGHDVGLTDGMDAGKAAMLASVREKIAGMKIKHERHPDDKTWCNYCGYNDAIRDALSTLE